jgi:hypothetical protein
VAVRLRSCSGGEQDHYGWSASAAVLAVQAVSAERFWTVATLSATVGAMVASSAKWANCLQLSNL